MNEGFQPLYVTKAGVTYGIYGPIWIGRGTYRRDYYKIAHKDGDSLTFYGNYNHPMDWCMMHLALLAKKYGWKIAEIK